MALTASFPLPSLATSNREGGRGYTRLLSTQLIQCCTTVGRHKDTHTHGHTHGMNRCSLRSDQVEQGSLLVPSTLLDQPVFLLLHISDALYLSERITRIVRAGTEEEMDTYASLHTRHATVFRARAH